MTTYSPADIEKQIGAIVGAEHIRIPSAREAVAAALIAEPASAGEIAEIVRCCEAGKISLAPIGAARTLAQIRSAPAALGVSLARMTRVIAHEPDDMTVVAEAGITVAALNAAMTPARQRLPVDPANPGATTLGALVAAHHAGPIRLCEGTVRDLMIGIRYVGRGGDAIHAGGRVVKNVAGYDLMKVMGGSFGTLGIITELTFKVRPLPAEYGLALTRFGSARAAFAAADVLHDSLPLAHLEVLSPAVSAACGFERTHLMLAGFSGNRSETDFIRTQIASSIGASTEFLSGADATGAYERLRDGDIAGFALAAQIAVAPAELGKAAIASHAEFYAHAGSGVAIFCTAEAASRDDAAATIAGWREAAHAARGHVRVLHAAPELRGAFDFFDTPNPGALTLMRRMKSAFDPAGIFNPGCFVGGI